jgi:hypothetical protein
VPERNPVEPQHSVTLRDSDTDPTSARIQKFLVRILLNIRHIENNFYMNKVDIYLILPYISLFAQ